MVPYVIDEATDSEWYRIGPTKNTEETTVVSINLRTISHAQTHLEFSVSLEGSDDCKSPNKARKKDTQNKTIWSLSYRV